MPLGAPSARHREGIVPGGLCSPRCSHGDGPAELRGPVPGEVVVWHAEIRRRCPRGQGGCGALRDLQGCPISWAAAHRGQQLALAHCSDPALEAGPRPGGGRAHHRPGAHASVDLGGGQAYPTVQGQRPGDGWRREEPAGHQPQRPHRDDRPAAPATVAPQGHDLHQRAPTGRCWAADLALAHAAAVQNEATADRTAGRAAAGALTGPGLLGRWVEINPGLDLNRVVDKSLAASLSKRMLRSTAWGMSPSSSTPPFPLGCYRCSRPRLLVAGCVREKAAQAFILAVR